MFDQTEKWTVLWTMSRWRLMRRQKGMENWKGWTVNSRREAVLKPCILWSYPLVFDAKGMFSVHQRDEPDGLIWDFERFGTCFHCWATVAGRISQNIFFKLRSRFRILAYIQMTGRKAGIHNDRANPYSGYREGELACINTIHFITKAAGWLSKLSSPEISICRYWVIPMDRNCF